MEIVERERNERPNGPLLLSVVRSDGGCQCSNEGQFRALVAKKRDSAGDAAPLVCRSSGILTDIRQKYRSLDLEIGTYFVVFQGGQL